MHAILRFGLLSGGVAIAAGLGAIATAAGEGDGEVVDWTAKAKQAWGKTCQKCHTVPDPKFETGRAYLSQIKETT